MRLKYKLFFCKKDSGRTMNNINLFMNKLKSISQKKLNLSILRRIFIVFLYLLEFPDKKIERILCLSRLVHVNIINYTLKAKFNKFFSRNRLYQFLKNH